MADASAWAGFGTTTDASDRADAAWDRINEKPSSIRFIRGNNPKVTLPAQTIRIEYSNQTSNSEPKGGAGMSGSQRAIIFGIRGHETEPDTDVLRDDRFAFNGQQFRVITVIFQTGEKQAMCEAQS